MTEASSRLAKLDELVIHTLQMAQARNDLITLTSYMAEQNYTAEEIAYAVQKPNKHADVLAQAVAAQMDQESGEVVQIVLHDPLLPSGAPLDRDFFKKLSLVPNPNADYAYCAGCGGQEPVEVLDQMEGYCTSQCEHENKHRFSRSTGLVIPPSVDEHD